MKTSMTSLAGWRGLIELRPDVERALVGHCRDKSELDDLVQETMLRAARFRGSLTDAACLRPWLLRIALNVLRDHVRRECRLKRVESAEECLIDVEGRERAPGHTESAPQIAIGAQRFEREDLLQLLDELLLELDGGERELFEAYYKRGMGCHGAAQQLRINTDTIKMRLYRLRKKLRRELQRRSMLELLPSLRGRGAVA